MKHIKTFENYSDTNPDVIVNKEINQNGEFYSVDKTGLEGIMYYYFKERLLKENTFSFIQIFIGFAEFFQINYDQLYGEIGVLDKEGILKELNKKEKIKTKKLF